MMEPPELTKKEQQLMALFGLEETQSTLLTAKALVAIHKMYPVREVSDWRLTQAWVSFKIKTEPGGDELELAIWRDTGNVYLVTAGGVEEDPIIVITPISI